MRCRKIVPADAPRVVRLLAEGFPAHGEAWWSRALARLEDHASRLDAPAYGYVLDIDGEIRGVLLLIHASRSGEDDPRRCNLSSWYVQKAYAPYASLLSAQATKQRDVTYVNVSPAAHTRPIIEAQGFVVHGRGRFLALPALGPVRPGMQVGPLDLEGPDGQGLDPVERRLLQRHVGYGCFALSVREGERMAPFLFLPGRIRKMVRSVRLIYCRDIADFVEASGAIGRYLLRRGIAVAAIDADGPLEGVLGRHRLDATPKYVKGTSPPRVGDLTDTEIAMFGYGA